MTYVDEGPFKPLRIRDLELIATNIRNRPVKRPYPSDVRFSAVVFESGRVSADGQVNFLAEPNPTFRGDIDIADIQLDYFKPITNRYNLWVDKGVLSANGHVEYAQETKTVRLTRAAIDGIHVDYVHTAPTAGAEKAVRGKAADAAKQASNAPDLLVQIGELRLTRSTVGFVNKAVSPSYRVFLADTDGTLTNLSNQQSEGTAVAKLKGAFMGSGAATADATFRTDRAGPSFGIGVRVEEVDVTTLNDLFRAYGRFDTSAGRFFLYSELDAKDGVITGYLKPLVQGSEGLRQEAGPVQDDGAQDVRAPRGRRREAPQESPARGGRHQGRGARPDRQPQGRYRGRDRSAGSERLLQGDPARVRPRSGARRPRGTARGEMTGTVRVTE